MSSRPLPLPGLMMDAPLLIGSLIDHAAAWHGSTEIVTREGDGSIVRATWREVRDRSARLAHALQSRLGIAPGDRIATLAWNSQRHLELYYAISGTGAVCHTINPRLFPEQLVYIVNHARDRVIFVDIDLVPLLEKLHAQLPHVAAYVVMTDAAHMPASALPNLACYETLLDGQPATIAWPEFDERTASSLCYTSGTTGNPKGALYTHRSTVIHAFSGAASHQGRAGALTAILPVVPMFHVNAWGLPYIAPITGSKLVMPGRHLDPASLYDLFEREGVTFTAGVPTIWFWLLAWMKEHGKRFSSLLTLGVGGSAAPPALIAAFEALDVEVLQGWGMTETSPTCTTGRLKPAQEQSPDRMSYKAKAGRCLYGVRMRIVDDAGVPLPHDGEAQGELHVRGPWVASAYYDDAAATAAAFTDDGWFRTGDIASLDGDGYLTIRDRSKDVIKSGGEWISSVELENVAIAHPDVAEAAAIGVHHPTWSERPVLVIVPKTGTTPTRDAITTFLEGKVAKWWLPDDVLFVAELPHTATGKVSKRLLRDRLAGYRLPSSVGSSAS